WEKAFPEYRVCLPEALAGAHCTGTLQTEAGEIIEWKWRASDWPVKSVADLAGTKYVYKSLVVPTRLPYGYHEFSLEIGGKRHRSRIICAPLKTYAPPGDLNNRIWGAFLPLYALETEKTMGSGDYTAFGELAEIVAGWGGNVVGTLPLLPVFLDEPYDPGPYSPVSRRFWNEFYVDVKRVPELADCATARELVESPSFKAEVEKARKTDMVDYRRVMALKRSVMEELCRQLLSAGGRRLEEFRQFGAGNPHVMDYARFRAVTEKRGVTWLAWPQRLRDGEIRDADCDAATRDYHLYAQWLAHRQVEELAAGAAKHNVTMYFDLPLGVNGAGYDVWSHREVFSLRASTGAPPDAVFTSGQNWGFPPILPDEIRRDGYRYIIAYLEHHLRHAGMLRIDHVMGLHRLFWIPQEMSAADGVYVRYNPEELYAIVTLESHRHQCVIVGEDLGIVPSYVRRSMSRHGLHRMSILHYELLDDDGKGLGHIPRNVVAAMNTHDMPPFATFWKGTDIDERKSLGLVGEAVAAREREARPGLKASLTAFLSKQRFIRNTAGSVKEIMRGCLAYMSASRARVLLVNLEDLWLETGSQNIPGTVDEHPNWQRKARYRLEEIDADADIRAALTEIDSLRKGKPTGRFQ
ncbi:MAG: 4-alpha-glucanotransferase, partial [Dehalococcoidales bacterium]|nr:4-alpha-glucanotransferase [Dehalococcoidales bacterium]